jgi:glycosyltransferase involved in cell wall biosynthesis
MKAGFDEAVGGVIISMDGDGQNDPHDIPALLEKLDEGFDVVAGWRRNRMDRRSKVLISRLGARVQRWLLNEELHDSACTLRAYRSWVVRDLDLSGSLHRFLPALLRMRGARIGEVVTKDRPRTRGQSNYRVTKVFPGLLELCSIWFRQRFDGPRPGAKPYAIRRVFEQGHLEAALEALPPEVRNHPA